MSEPRYDLLFKGDILPGCDRAQVMAKVANMFSRSADQVRAMFSGQLVTIKANVDRATAVKYQQAFKQAGAKLGVKAVAVKASDAAPQPQQRVSNTTFDVAPAGSDLGQQRPPLPQNDIATDHLQLQNSFAEPQANPFGDKSTLDHLQANEVSGATLSLDPLGSQIDQSEAPPPVAIFEENWDLAPPGADLDTLKESVEAVVVSTDHLSLRP